jgi:DHA2 family multidrug resistance protein
MFVEANDEGWTPLYSAAGRHSPWLITVILSMATFMEVLDTSVANISLRHIGGDLSSTSDEATWVLTSYLVANAVIVPLSSWLSDRLGRKHYYMISVALFTFSSLACALAPSLSWLIVARVAQGIGGGGLAPCEQSMLVDTFPPSKRGKAIAGYGLVLVFGPAFGPTIGGLITDALSWRWIFLINIPVGLLSLVLVQALVNEPVALVERSKARQRYAAGVDFPGFILVALGLGCLQIAIDRGQQADWLSSPSICALVAIAFVSLCALCVWELRCPSPVLNIRLFANRDLTLACAVMGVTGASMYATTQMVPQFLQQVLGYTASDAGLAMTVSSMATLLMTGMTALLSNRVPARQMILAGLVIEAVGLYHTTGITDHMGFWTMALNRVWLVAGLPLILAPLTTGAYAKLSADDTNQASAFLNLFRNIGGAAGISAAQTILVRRGAWHGARMLDDISLPQWRSSIERYSRAFHPLYQFGPLTDVRANAMVGLTVRRQALLLSYIDVFWTFAVFTACVIPFVFLMRTPSRNQARS